MCRSSLPPVVCRRAHVLFTLVVFVRVQGCPTPIVLCFCFVCLHLVYPILPVSQYHSQNNSKIENKIHINDTQTHINDLSL